MGELGNLQGGIGVNAWRGMALAGIRGGMTAEQAMPLFMGLRQGVGMFGAESLIGSAATSNFRFGMDRNSAVSALSGLSTMQGGAAQADARLEQIFTRAFRAGFHDTAVQSAMAVTLPGLLGGVGGRASSVGHAAQVLTEATQGFGGGMAGFNMSTQAYQLQGSIGGTGGPVQALNVAQASSIFRVSGKYGLTRTTQLALVTIASQNPAALKEARPGSQIWEMIASEGKDPGPILAELGAGSAGVVGSFMRGMDAENPGARCRARGRA